MTRSSRVLLDRIDAVLSSVSLTEFVRVMGPENEAAVRYVEKSIHVIGLQRGAAQLAGSLLNQLRRRQDICPRCFNARDSAACPGCQRQVSAQQKIIDAMIVATAELAPDIDVLFSFDAGMHAFLPLLTACDIREPPLFDNVVSLDRPWPAAPR
jgi:hypothetical protein